MGVRMQAEIPINLPQKLYGVFWPIDRVGAATICVKTHREKEMCVQVQSVRTLCYVYANRLVDIV